MFEQEPVVEDGEIVLSDAPGLGLSFDARVLDRAQPRGADFHHAAGSHWAAARGIAARRRVRLGIEEGSDKSIA